MPRQALRPEGLARPKPPSAPVVVAEDTVSTAGQIARDEDGDLVAGGIDEHVVRRACRRGDLPEVAARRLRHTFASELLREGGASLTEIGQVLRHRDLATTAIYAKVDLGRLRQVAQPGRERGDGRVLPVPAGVPYGCATCAATPADSGPASSPASRPTARSS